MILPQANADVCKLWPFNHFCGNKRYIESKMDGERGKERERDWVIEVNGYTQANELRRASWHWKWVRGVGNGKSVLFVTNSFPKSCPSSQTCFIVPKNWINIATSLCIPKYLCKCYPSSCRASPLFIPTIFDRAQYPIVINISYVMQFVIKFRKRI